MNLKCVFVLTSSFNIFSSHPLHIALPDFEYSIVKSLRANFCNLSSLPLFLPFAAGTMLTPATPTFSLTLSWSSSLKDSKFSISAVVFGRCFAKKQWKWYQFGFLPSWKGDWKSTDCRIYWKKKLLNLLEP